MEDSKPLVRLSPLATDFLRSVNGDEKPALVGTATDAVPGICHNFRL
jgi:hypothetical protein